MPSKMNIRVPAQTGLVGLGSHRYDNSLRVPLTTIDQNRLEIGERATSLLLKLIQGKGKSGARVILIKPKVIIEHAICLPGILGSLPTGNGRACDRSTSFFRASLRQSVVGRGSRPRGWGRQGCASGPAFSDSTGCSPRQRDLDYSVVAGHVRVGSKAQAGV
jgi:hypothetical protein